MENTMSDGSFKQATHLLAFVGQKDPQLEQLQLLYTSGLLSDLFDGNIKEVDRDEFRGILGLCPLDKKIVEVARETMHQTFRVNYAIKGIYPEWLKKRLHQEFDRTDTVEYRFDRVKPWLHPTQENGGVIGGKALYQYIRESDILPTCLALRDLEEIQKLGIEVFRQHFRGKAVFAWKDVVQNRDGRLYVPYLVERGGKVVIYWYWLGFDWDGLNPALRVAS